jgi:hypothetical protein
LTALHKNRSWSFLKKFGKQSANPVQDWQPIARLKEKAREALAPCIREHEELERNWRKKLQPLCGDGSSYDWDRFRPLLHDREEDWSDWLAWLLETSQTGLLAKSLFTVDTNIRSELFALDITGSLNRLLDALLKQLK